MTKEILEETPTDEAIWKGTRHKDITRKIRDFLWKHTHGIYRIGALWTHIPGHNIRPECPIRGKYDTFEHIASECDSTERMTVGDQAHRLWKQRYDEDRISEGAVLSGGLANPRKDEGKPDAAKGRLYGILIAESAHLIWDFG